MARRPTALIVLIDAARREDTYRALAASQMPVLAGAAHGTLIAPSCWTVPSVVSLLTGRFPSEHGLAWPLDEMGCRVPTVADHFARAGRSFGLLSANQVYAPPLLELEAGQIDFGLHRWPGATGIGRTLGLVEYPGPALLRRVREMAATGTIPDLLVIHVQQAHHPYLLPPTGLSPLARIRYGLGYVAYHALKSAQVWEFAARATARDWEDARRRYLQCLEYDVRILEGVLQAWADAGLLDEGLVIITADHGEHLGEHGLADHQASLHEQLVNVPCALLAPDIAAGTEIPGLFQHTDLLLTVANFLGVPLEGYEPACEPLDMLDPANYPTGHEHTFMEWSAWGEETLARLRRRNPSYDFDPLNRDLAGVRTSRWKYVEGSDGTRVLWDLCADPDETRNVSREYPDVAAALGEVLGEWRARVGAVSAPSEADEHSGDQLVERRLRDLGYL